MHNLAIDSTPFVFILATYKVYFKFLNQRIYSLSYDSDYRLYFFTLGNIDKSTFFRENNSQ